MILGQWGNFDEHAVVLLNTPKIGDARLPKVVLQITENIREFRVVTRLRDRLFIPALYVAMRLAALRSDLAFFRRLWRISLGVALGVLPSLTSMPVAGRGWSSTLGCSGSS